MAQIIPSLYPTADFQTGSILDASITNATTNFEITHNLEIPLTNGVLQLGYASTQALGADNGPETIQYATYTKATGAITGATRGIANTTAVAHSSTEGKTVQCGMSSVFLTDFNRAWTAYTPTWTAASVNPSLGNGTITGKYIKLGRLVHFKIKLIIGTTTTLGTGDWRFTLPAASTAADRQVVGVSYLEHVGISSTSGTFIVSAAAADKIESLSLDATHPFAWAANDYFNLIGTYESAS